MNRFRGVVLSEWIKFRSVRSNLWALAAIAVVQVLVGFGMAEDIQHATTAVANTAAVVATTGLAFNELVAVVLGVLVISNEYSTGQIRSTFAAVPNRVLVLAAKAIVFGAVSFVVGLAAIGTTYVATAPLLAGGDQHARLGDPHVWLGLVGGAMYLSLTGLIGMAIAAILRSTALSITLGLGLFVIASSYVPWLPGSAGRQMFLTGGMLHPWQALLIVLAWVTVLMLGGTASMKRRDA